MNEKKRVEDLLVDLCVLSWTGAGEELRMGRKEGGFYILLLWSIVGIRF